MSCGHLAEIGLPQDDPSVFNVDANNMFTLVYNIISSKLTRHINRRELIVPYVSVRPRATSR